MGVVSNIAVAILLIARRSDILSLWNWKERYPDRPDGKANGRAAIAAIVTRDDQLYKKGS